MIRNWSGLRKALRGGGVSPPGSASRRQPPSRPKKNPNRNLFGARRMPVSATVAGAFCPAALWLTFFQSRLYGRPRNFAGSYELPVRATRSWAIPPIGSCPALTRDVRRSPDSPCPEGLRYSVAATNPEPTPWPRCGLRSRTAGNYTLSSPACQIANWPWPGTAAPGNASLLTGPFPASVTHLRGRGVTEAAHRPPRIAAFPGRAPGRKGPLQRAAIPEAAGLNPSASSPCTRWRRRSREGSGCPPAA
jgi:hypothetical protein